VLGPLDHYRKDKELLERIQRRYTKMINDMNGKTYEDRLGLRCLRLWTLEEREGIGRIVLRFSKYIEGLVIFCFISFLSWIQMVKVSQ